MRRISNTARLTLTALTACVAWAGLGLQFFLSMRELLGNGWSPGAAIVWYFSFFTILTNVLVATSLTLLWAAPSSKAGAAIGRPIVQTGITAAIVLVGSGYELLLRGLSHLQGLRFVADFTLHDVVPVLAVLYWIFSVPKGTLAWQNLWWWLIYPGVYLVYALVYGALTGRYPYPFLDLGKLGIAPVLMSSAALLAALLCIGFALVGIDRWLGRRAAAGSAQESV